MHHIHNRRVSIPLPSSRHKVSKLQRMPPRVLATVIIPRRRQHISPLPVESLVAIARRVRNDKRILPHTVVADLLVAVVKRDRECCGRVEGMGPASYCLSNANRRVNKGSLSETLVAATSSCKGMNTHLIYYRLQIIRAPFVFEAVSYSLDRFWLLTHDWPRSPSAEYSSLFSSWNTVPPLDVLGAVRQRQERACDVVER